MEPIKKRDMSDDFVHLVWLGNKDKFYYNRVSRDLKRMDVCAVEIGTDTSKVIIEERMNTYIEVRDSRLVKESKEIIHWSERNGWAHLYLYDENGKLKNAITSGEYHVEDVVAVDPVQRVVYFTANGREQGENPYYTHQ